MENTQKLRAKKDVSLRHAESMLLSPFPIVGNIRNPAYFRLVNDANFILFERLFGGQKRSHILGFYASCCGAFGEKRHLLQRGHQASTLQSVGRHKGIHIQDKQDLYKMITGEEPQDKEQPWMVQFPRTLVWCTKSQTDNATTADSQDTSYDKMAQEFKFTFSDKTTFLGKRKPNPAATRTQIRQTLSEALGSPSQKDCGTYKTQIKASESEIANKCKVCNWFTGFHCKTNEVLADLLTEIHHNLPPAKLLKEVRAIWSKYWNSSWLPDEPETQDNDRS